MNFLRYVRGTPLADRFGTIRYPARHNVTREQAEHMRQAMPDPDAFEIVEED
jgi:hypothetical protein